MKYLALLLVLFSCASVDEEPIINEAPKFTVGEKGPAGIVIYDKGNEDGGWRYLEVSPENMGSFEWGCLEQDIPGTKEDIGSGMENSLLIQNRCSENSIAAKAALGVVIGGKDDWYLPSHQELRLIHEYKDKVQLPYGHYWSSSQSSEYTAFIILSSNAPVSTSDKNGKYLVRPVRRFK